MTKSRIIKILAILIIVVALVLTSNVVIYAETIISDPSMYEPTIDNSSTATNVIATILSILMVIGVITFVVGLVLIGFGMILGSASEKAVAKEKIVGMLIAAILLIAGSAIAQVIMNFAGSIGDEAKSEYGGTGGSSATRQIM